jgi:ABC-type bacteriocin/lantibiotic exporter with double-glycine peptidase domain
MPERWLSVPHYQQSDEATCLAACARMVLAYLGDQRSEQELVRLLEVDPAFGVPASRLLRLRQWGYQVTYDSLSLPLLRHWLDQGVPPIVLVRTDFLAY